MNRKQLPKENEICYVTMKIDPNTEIEELGYLTSYPVEPSKFKEELGYYDEHMDLFRHLTVTVPIIDWNFSIDNLVSWRDINGWISVEDRLPDDGQEVLIVWNGGTRIAIADLVPDGRALFSFRFEHVDNAEWNAIYRYSGEIKFWQPLPPPPSLTKAT